MKNYDFKYTVTPKPEDKTWWCDIIGQHFECEAESLQEAKEMFQSHMDNTWSVEILKSALAKPDKMYRDRKGAPPEVVGYVFTGHHEVEFKSGWKDRICWVWTTVREYEYPEELNDYK